MRIMPTMCVAALAGALCVLTTGCTAMMTPAGGADPGTAIPAAILDDTTAAGDSATAVLAGGCFWGVQGVFEHVKGVRRAVAGYAGGAADSAHYDEVSTGETGHAESVRVSYDPHQISYGKLLQIYFSVAHDPTEKDRQGPDVGTQYRSAIFPQDETQERIADAYIAQLDAAHVFPAPIATTVESWRAFYPAEDYHQDFMNDNPSDSYIARNDTPKLADLERVYPALYSEHPVLVKG